MISKASFRSHPIHPILVAFPIGLWVTAFIFDLIGAASHETAYFYAGFYMIIAGCIGAVAAAIPGVIDLFGSIPPNSAGRTRGYLHGTLNVAALVIFIIEAVRRSGRGGVADGPSLLLSLAGVVLIGISGWLGGTLVFSNQVGVDHHYANAGKFKQRVLDGFDRPVCNTRELSEGQMMLAVINGQRVTVGKCSEGMFAFGDRCSHRGGPLSDGALIGCTVQCPWHGSQFDVRNGRVVAGPAGQKIRVYQVAVRGGEVYVTPEVPADEQKVA